MPTNAELQIVRGVLVRNRVVDLILDRRPDLVDVVRYEQRELRLRIELADGREVVVGHLTDRGCRGWAVVVSDRDRPQFRSSPEELAEMALTEVDRLGRELTG